MLIQKLQMQLVLSESYTWVMTKICMKDVSAVETLECPGGAGSVWGKVRSEGYTNVYSKVSYGVP